MTPADFEITSEDMPGWLVASEGKLTVALDITLTEELRAECVARELINRIQNIRKDSGFEDDGQDPRRDRTEGVRGRRDRQICRIYRIADARRRGESGRTAEGGVVVDSDVDDEPIRIAVTRI